MENSSTKLEALKPVLLKAGISVALSVAGYNLAKAFWNPSPKDARKIDQGNDSSERLTDEEVRHDRVDEYELVGEISCMRSRIKEIQQRLCDLEMRFIRYHDLKERESMLMVLHSTLLTEINSIESLGKEVSAMEADHRRFENMVVDYLDILELLEVSRLENQSLHKRVKRLWKKLHRSYRLVKEKSLQVEAKNAEISRNHGEIKTKIDTITGMEEEVRKMEMTIGQLQSEKHELLNRLDLAENSASSKTNMEVVSIEDFNKVVNELEQLQKDRAAEAKELIFLRWCHSRMRHELMRSNQQQEEEMEGMNRDEPHQARSEEYAGYGSDNELDSANWRHRDSCLVLQTTGGHHHAHSRRRRLLEKFKRWVDGSEKSKHKLDEKEEKHESKFFGKHTVSKDANNLLDPARKSCASA